MVGIRLCLYRFIFSCVLEETVFSSYVISGAYELEKAATKHETYISRRVLSQSKSIIKYLLVLFALLLKLHMDYT